MATAVYFHTSLLDSAEYVLLEDKHGPMAAAMLFKLDLWLWSQKDHELDTTYVRAIGNKKLGFSADAFEAFVSDAIDLTLLTEQEGMIRSPRVDDQLEGLQKRTRGLKNSPLRPRDGSVTEPVTAPLQDKTRQDQIGLDQIGSEGGPGETTASAGAGTPATSDPEPPPGKTLHGKYVWLSDIEVSQFRATHKDQVLREAIRLANARIEALEGRPAHAPMFEKLRDEARNGGAVLTKWALREAFNRITDTEAKKANLEAAKARQARATARPEPPPKPNPRERISGPIAGLVAGIVGGKP